ncbi:MAG: diadenylate cyclase [Desulfobacterales bacterium]|nr:MAG: diadenylate cyclase [Desulfobacterales bacterium]
MESFGSLILIKALLNWRSTLDILLMAAGLFFLYRTLLRLGTWRIVVGILAGLGLFLIASFLDLRGIEWIFGNLSQVAAIALIVIFQPEIRKIFERAVSVRRSETGDREDELSQIVADSLWKMSQQHRGAIAVFPGKEPIEEWLAGGYKLDAKPSIPLIMSIFDPNSPGHDGALIIQNGKFRRFGVRLPVSQSSRLPEEYGTRHHAAMGLAEKSDALVIVVSEERGRVSFFKNGRFRAAADPDQICKKIISHWKETVSYVIKMPDRELRWKLFPQILASLIVAMFFWSTLIIAQGEMLEKIISVPVEYTASPANLILVGDKQKEVRLHLAGPKSDLDSINAAQLNVKVDLSKAAAGKQTFPITGENIRMPRNVKILDVVPSGVELTLAEIEEREVPIKPQLIGKLPGGLKVLELKMVPERVKVLSPAAAGKDKVSSVITTPIYLESIYNDTSVFCKIIAPSAVQPVEKRWPDVEVQIKVGY